MITALQHRLSANKEKYDQFIHLALQADEASDREKAKEYLHLAKNSIDKDAFKKIFFYFLVAYKSYEVQSDTPLKQIIDSFRFMEDKKIKELLSNPNGDSSTEVIINKPSDTIDLSNEILFEFSPEEVFFTNPSDFNEVIKNESSEDTFFEPSIDQKTIEVDFNVTLEIQDNLSTTDYDDKIQANNTKSDQYELLDFDISSLKPIKEATLENPQEILSIVIGDKEILLQDGNTESSQSDSLPNELLHKETQHTELDFVIETERPKENTSTEVEIKTHQNINSIDNLVSGFINKKNMPDERLIPTLTDIVFVPGEKTNNHIEPTNKFVYTKVSDISETNQKNKVFKTWVNWFLLMNESMVMQRDYLEMNNDPRTKEGIFEIEDMLYAKANGQPWAVSVITTNN